MNKYEKIFNKEGAEIDYQYELKKANLVINNLIDQRNIVLNELAMVRAECVMLNEEKIAKNILSGIELNKETQVILNRKEAIIEGINNLEKDSVLLILGKGHEKIQEFKDSSVEFSDQKIVKEYIKEKL